MRDLPPGLTTFNDACLAQQRAQPRQPALAANREHVRAIVAEAQRPAPGLLAYAGARPCAAGTSTCGASLQCAMCEPVSRTAWYRNGCAQQLSMQELRARLSVGLWQSRPLPLRRRGAEHA